MAVFALMLIVTGIVIIVVSLIAVVGSIFTAVANPIKVRASLLNAAELHKKHIQAHQRILNKELALVKKERTKRKRK